MGIHRLFVSVFILVSVNAASPSVSALASTQADPSPPELLEPVRVRAQAEGLELSPYIGKGLQELPLAGRQVSRSQMREAGVLRLSDVTNVDASVTDSYNANGYWDSLSVRGYLLDPRSSYFREGLPISAETWLPLDNKTDIEILKGLSGVQAGASSPGGTVNLTVARPPVRGRKHEFQTGITDEGGYQLGSVLSGRDLTGDHGYRAQAVFEELRPKIENSKGTRFLFSWAQDWQLSDHQLLQGEVEYSKSSQKSQAAQSLWGNIIPPTEFTRRNLNDQLWTQPVIFTAMTGTLRYQQELGHQWNWQIQLGLQALVTDDRLAYPFGCSSENNFDRYCSDGSYDLYDFRSENEKRTTQALKNNFQWTGSSGVIKHNFNLGFLHSQFRANFDRQAYNLVGVGNSRNSVQLPEDPSLQDENTQRQSHITEVFIHDALEWQAWTLWLGARAQQIDRKSVRTDGSRATAFREVFVLPSIALSYKFEPAMIYASYSEGIETFVTPNRATYTQPGVFLKDTRSRQTEIGIKGHQTLEWSGALFDIQRPLVTDAAPLYQVDGEARHRGVEIQMQKRIGRLAAGASAVAIRAERQQSELRADLNGRRPVNVPTAAVRAFAEYEPRQVSGLKLMLRVSHEQERAVTEDNALTLPAWIRWDGGFSYNFTGIQGAEPAEVQVSIQNISDSKFWQESPTQYGHIYLYPSSERSLAANLTIPF